MDTNVYSVAEQRDAARMLANTVRCANARTLKGIAELPSDEGLRAAAVVLRDARGKGPTGTIPVRRLLTAPRGMGDTKAAQLLRVADVFTGDRRLRQLTPRQREVLVAFLEEPWMLWPHGTEARKGARSHGR